MLSSGSFSREEEDIAATPQGDGAGPSKSSPSKDRRKSKQQPRQLLSCSKCRERKVRVSTDGKVYPGTGTDNPSAIVPNHAQLAVHVVILRTVISN